jgi:hypothetical protein
MRRGWIAGVVAAVVLVGIAVVRSGESPRVVALAEAAERIEGESMLMRFTMGISDSEGDYAIRGQGPWTADSSRGSAVATVTFENERPIRMTLLNVGRDYWFRSRAFAPIMPRGKRWVHSFDRAGPATTLTPSQLASFLAEADYVEEVGESRVLDQAATHYQGMVDLNDLADEIGGDTKEQLQAALEKENVPDDRKPGMPIEAWISKEDGLPLRIRCSGGDGESSMDMTIDILEYGVEVDVRPPPPSAVIEEAEFDRLTGG